MKKQVPSALLQITKKSFYVTFIAFLVAIGVSQNANAQIPVTVTGNTNTTPNLLASYTSLANALTDLNLVTAMTGPVTLTLDASSSETTPPTGLTIGSSTLNLVLNSTNTVTINKAVGGPTVLNAGLGTSTPGSAAPDGILKIVGADYITVDGLTFTDANVANPATMEFGIALFKLSVTDGAQNNRIMNCIFNMQRINNATGGGPMAEGAIAINVVNSIPTAAVTSLTPTTAAGTNSNNRFYSNTINGGNYGIVLNGFAASSPFTAGDTGNDIGGFIAGTGNTILNFGGAPAAPNPAAGIRANNQWSVNISNNTINNNNGGGVNHPITLRGIFGQAGTSANATINNNTVTVNSGATTSACTAIENSIGSTAAGNTVSINSNIIQNCTYSTSTSGAFIGILNTASAATVNMNGNTVSNNSIAGTGTNIMISNTATLPNLTINSNSVLTNDRTSATTGTQRGINVGSPATGSVIGNTIDGMSFTNIASTGSIDGIYSFSSAVNVTMSFNTVRNLSTPTTGTITGIRESGASGIKTLQNNEVYNFSTTAGGVGGATFNGIISSSGTIDISNNRAYTLNSGGTTGGTSGTLIGILVSGGTASNVYKNKVYDISSTSTNPTVSGITLSGGSNNNVYNNLIGDLRTPFANAANPLIGINITGGTTHNIYYNTVYLAGSSAGALFGSSAISASSTPTVNLRNNIFTNLSSVTGAGLAVAYRRSTTTLTTYAATSNHNLFYAGTPGAANLIFYDGTNSDQMLSAFKARVSPRDANSVTENLSGTFLSTNGASGGFLHINPAIPTQVESGAAAIATFTDDYDGDVRNGSFSDIGADEGAFIGLDLTGPAISYTILNNTSCTTDRTLSATIVDPSGVNILPGTKPRLYFRKTTNANAFNDNTSGTDGWKYVEATNAGSPFSFTTNYSLLFGGGGVVIGDTIRYFIVAQDNAATPNVSINSGSFATAPSSVALVAGNFPVTGIVNGYAVIAVGLSGTVTVGAAEPYHSLTEAGVFGLFAEVNLKGLSGNLTVNIVDASVTETGAVALNAIGYNGCVPGPYTLTIKATTTSTLTGSLAGALIKLNGADFVTIDGSVGSTPNTICPPSAATRELTITNTNTSSSAAVVWLQTASGDGATNNIIKNCNIVGSGVTGTTGTLIGIGSGSSTVSSSSLGTANNNNQFVNNNVSKVQFGIYSQGASAANKNTGTIINQNLINAASPNQVTRGGILVGFDNGVSISGNNIGNMSGTTSNDAIAISLGTSAVLFSSFTGNEVTSALVSKNIINNIRAASTYSAIGIVVVSTANAGSNEVSNNMINDVLANGTASDFGASIFLGGGTSGSNVYYNTINTVGSLTGGSFDNFGIAVAGSNPTVDLRNNIIVNTTTHGTGFTYALGFAYTTFTNLTSDFNDLYTSGAASKFVRTATLSNAGGVDYLTLSAWQTASGKDAASKNILPVFMSPTNLHLDATNATNLPLDNGATSIGSVPDDIDCQLRMTDIGADEFVPISGKDVGATALVSPASFGCYTATEMVTVTIKNFSADPLDFSVNNVTVTVTATGGYNSNVVLSSGILASGATQNVTMPATIDLSIPGSYTFNATAVVAGDIVPANDGMAPVIRTSLVLGGVYPVGAGQSGMGGFETITAAVTAYNTASCFTGPVVFRLHDAAYNVNETFPIVITDNDAAGTNFLIIRPNTSISPTISGSVTSALIKLNGADYITIDGSNNGSDSKDLTIENTNAGTSSAVIWIASTSSTGATNNTIKNTTVKGNAPLTTFGGIIASGSILGGVAEVANASLTIQNNTIIRSQYGIASAGVIGGQSGTTIVDNTVGSSTPADYVGFRGLFISNSTGATINSNGIFNIVTSALNPSGMFIGAGVTNSTINANFIDNIRYTGTSGYGGKGMDVNTGNPASNLTISNNMISNIGGDGWSSLLGDAIVGIRIGATGGATTTTGGVNVIHNTIHLSGSFAGSTSGTASAALYLSSTATALDVRDNILVTSLDNTATGTDKTWAINSAGANTAFTAIDYNDYWVSGTPGKLGFISSADRLTLADIQAGFGSNLNSLNIEPIFTSANDLHLIPASNVPLNNLGTPIAAVTTDIDGDTRDVTNPDMGADEFSTSGCTTPLGGTASVTGPSSFCGSGEPDISASGFSDGVGTSYQWMTSTSSSDYPDDGVAVSMQTDPNELTTGIVSDTTYYWLRVVCSTGMDTAASNLLTITVNPSAGGVSGPSSKCANDPAIILMENGGTGTSWLWSTSETTQSITVNPSVTTTYTVTVTSPGACTAVASKTVVVNPNPAATATASANVVCPGSPFDLFSTPSSGTSTILNEGFESGAAGWVFQNESSTGNNLPLQLFHIESAPFSISGGSVSFTDFSVTGSNFILSLPDEGGSGSITNTNLVSPSFSTVGFTGDATLSFNQVYQYWNSSVPPETVEVQISTNGGTNWTNLANYEGDDVGDVTDDAQEAENSVVIVPAAYMGFSDVKIRFRYRSNWGYYWIFDDVLLQGNSLNTYSWDSDPAGFTSTMQNPTGVTQTMATTYTVTVTSAAGCSAEASTGVIGIGYVVKNTNDAGPESLRDVISCAPSGSTITFDPILAGQTITLTTGEIDINKNLTISGLGMLNLTISGGGTSRIFELLPTYDLEIENLAMKNGNDGTNGGAIYIQGDLILENVLLQNNLEGANPKSLTIAPLANLEVIGNVDFKN